MKSTQAEKGYGLNATVPNDNEANNDEPYVIYTVDSDPANQKVATLARCVMMCAITGAFLSFFHGIIYLTESYWFVGFFFLMGAGMCVYAGYYGAKRKDLCLLYSFAIVCAIFLGINLYEFIYEIVQLVKVGGMTDAEFLAAYPWFHSKSGYLWLGSASTVMIFAVIIFWGISEHYSFKLSKLVKIFPPAPQDTVPQMHRVYGSATPGVAPSCYYVEKQGNYSVAQPIAQGYPLDGSTAPPPYASYPSPDVRR